MSGARAAWLRGGLIFFTGVSVALGAYILISPVGFFSWSWINMGMPYNPHLLLDYGAMNPAAAIFLGGAAVTMNPAFVRTALASYSVWSVAHFYIHLHYRSHFIAHTSVGEANVLMGLLGFGAAAPIVLLLLTAGGRSTSNPKQAGKM